MTIWAPDLDHRSGPRYLAIANALADDLSHGRLKPGTRLPTHRDLAETLGVTVGTVSRAYAEAARRGLVSGEVGRGTFARGAIADFGVPQPAGVKGDLIDLSVNHPPASAAESAALASVLAEISRRPDLESLLSYAPDGGALRHRQAGARWIERMGLQAPPDRVVVTSGSQHSLTAVFTALLRPGDLILTEALTYPGMKALAGLLHLRTQGVPLDENGLRPDAFEAACKMGGVKALYCVPTIQNPTTSVMPEGRRREVAAIAREHGVLIVEDDIHGLLPEEPPLPIAAFAPEISCFLSSTAKSLAPGLRVGFVLAPEPLVARLAAAVRATTWMAAPLLVEIASAWIEDGTADRILLEKREEAARRQEMAADILQGHHFEAQPSGYHLWLMLPEPWRSETFAEAARGRGVAVTPSQAFLVGRGTAPHAVRVSLNAARERADVERGLSTLAQLLDGPPDAGIMIV